MRVWVCGGSTADIHVAEGILGTAGKSGLCHYGAVKLRGESGPSAKRASEYTYLSRTCDAIIGRLEPRTSDHLRIKTPPTMLL
jgi:hypothetical protein